MKKRVMGIEKVDLADAECTAVSRVNRQRKSTTYSEITDGGTEVIPVVAMVGVVGAEMMVVPVSPTVGTLSFTKGVPKDVGVVSPLPTERFGGPVPAIRLATEEAG